MSDTGTNALNDLAKRGMRQLFVRQVFTTGVSFLGGAVLARALSPADFGTYAIATFIVNIFMIFGDLGLGPAFIQNADDPTEKDLRVAFTVQFLLISAVVGLTWTLAPWIVRFYPAIGPNGMWLARTLSLLLFIPVFRSLSAIQLERKLNFKPVAWAEGVGIATYQLVAVVSALRGMGVWSFVLATFAAGIVGLGVMYQAAPWPIGFCFDFKAMRRAFKHGMSFQSASVVDVISQWATPAIVGTLLGPNAVGYLGLALANARRPLLLAESVMRVSFPHFSRLQADIKKLHDTTNDYLIGFLWFMVLWAGFLWTSGGPLVAIVYSPKWLPAVSALVIFALAVPLDIIIWTMGMCYRATNMNWQALKFFAARTGLNLTLAFILVPRIGFVGIPWAYLIADLVCAVLLLCGFAPGFFQRTVRTCWWLAPSAIGAFISGHLLAGLLVPQGITSPIQQFLAGAVPFGVSYGAFSVVLMPRLYRDRLFEAARSLVVSGLETRRRMQGMFGGVSRTYSVVRPESIGYAASED